MKLPDITNPPVGIGMLTFFYLLTSVIFAFSTILFYEYLDVTIFGIVVPAIFAVIIKIIFVLLPLFIYFGFTRFKRAAWITAICYHAFFIINGTMCMVDMFNKNFVIKPIFQIKAKVLPDFFKYLYIQENTTNQLTILIIGVILSVTIIIYLAKKQDWFVY